MENCICGGTLKVVRQTLLPDRAAKCSKCDRVYTERGDAWFLLIPWAEFQSQSKVVVTNQLAKKGQQVSVEWWCVRCGCPAPFDAQTFRVDCVICGYGQHMEDEGLAPAIKKLNSKRKALINELADLDGGEAREAEIVLELQRIKRAIENIQAEVL